MSNDATALITQTSASYAVDAGLAAQDEACPACTQGIQAGEVYCLRCGYQRGTWAAAPAAAGAGSAVVPAGPPSPWLLRAEDGREWRLAEGEQAAGRGEVEIRLEDNFASRRHAKLIVSADALSVQDLGSSNGTFIGGQRLSPGEAHELSNGSALRIGQTELLVMRSPLESHKDPEAAAISVELEGAAESEESPATAGAEPPALKASPWKLVSDTGTEIALPLGELTLGRKPDRCDRVLEGDTYISGIHCRLLATETSLSITDLGSTNGTYVSDEQLSPDTPRELIAGSVVRVGQTALKVQKSGAEEA